MEIINSEMASKLICIPKLTEPDSMLSCRDSPNGILVGMSMKRNMPIFLNMDDSLNPHILICGMTGGGKTFLARSLLARLALFSDSNVIAIDFTGEYGKIVSALQVPSGENLVQAFTDKEFISYFSLQNLPERNKIQVAHEIVDKVAIIMKEHAPERRRRAFILLDEAWKLMDRSKGLATIVREGRKYGVGLITSSQLLYDTNPTVLANVATVIVFKTTNVKATQALSKSYNLAENDISGIKELERGSCLIITNRISGIRSIYLARSVIGIAITELISIAGSDEMEAKISISEFETLLNSLCSPEETRSVKAAVKDGRIELSTFISLLIKAGADRRRIIAKIRELGFSDSDIADSFAIVLCKTGEHHETK